MTNRNNNGFRFTPYKAPHLTPFERLFDIFKELITHTSGDFDEAIDWLRELDKEYELTTPDYSIDDFIEELNKIQFINDRVTNLEMETAIIYGMSKILGHEAISLNAILANRENGTYSKKPSETINKLILLTLNSLSNL